MSPARMAASALMQERITAVLTARKGGTTLAELADVLVAKPSSIVKPLRKLVSAGRATIHTQGGRIARYTLADDPLTRPLDPCRTPEQRWAKHRRRRAIILRTLAEGSRHKATLARLCKVDDLGWTLARMVRDGEIEMVGEGIATRYRLPVVVRVKVAA